ncbi:type IV pilin-like G/H family protein [Microcoleus sp. OTE_8_concoct_300]|uniref:type IV pilin-like G/H family protein n=1 Tax=Microcoleus sp. OTE_8_concoct_300 TaxID=2964710 RepID=UPI00403F51F4
MTNTYFNFRNFLIISCLLPLNIGSSAIAQQSPKPTPTQSPNPALTNSRTSQFVGQWRLKDYLPIPLTVIFTQDGKLFVLLPSYLSSFLSTGSPSLARASVSAFEYRYEINSTAQPMQIDVISPAENETVATIFELTSDGQLRVEWEGINPGEPRPTEFTAGAIYLQKVANTTALPRNTQIIDLAAQQRQAKESEGQQYIGSMNSAQQAFYAENEKFATAIDDLGLGIKPETENYSYQIVPQSGSIPSAMMTAKAKSPELKSYTGAVFAIKVNGEFTSVSVVCGTDQPSTTPPAMPIAPKNAEEEIKCPAGSTAAE